MLSSNARGATLDAQGGVTAGVGAPAAGEMTAQDLSEHLALVGHVVQEMALRLPHADPGGMYNHGVLGLLVAVRRDDPALGNFGQQALRAIRAAVISNLRGGVATPADTDLAPLLGISVLTLRAARAATVASTNAAAAHSIGTSAAVVAPAPVVRPTTRTSVRPAFIGAH